VSQSRVRSSGQKHLAAGVAGILAPSGLHQVGSAFAAYWLKEFTTG
jgi:hypothetical protein